jgi:hypothetical protein
VKPRDPVTEALERFLAPFERDREDWHDVLDRAGERSRRRRAFAPAVLMAACVLAAILALVPPFGLAGRVVGLFEDKGKPVSVSTLTRVDREMLIHMYCTRIELVTSRGGRPEKRCSDGTPVIEEVARSKTRLYWKVTYPSGPTCLASGSPRGYRDSYGRARSRIGTMSCGPQVLPRPKRPITVDASMGGRLEDARATLMSARGLAGAGIESVGLVEEDGDVHRVDVEGRMYDFGRPPDRAWIAIAAYDESGDEVFRERLHLRWPRISRRPVRPPRPQPLPPLPKAQPIQHGETADATIDVYRSGYVRVQFKSTTTRAYEILRPRTGDRRVPIGCFEVAYGAGAWEVIGSGAYGIYGPEMRTVVVGPRGSGTVTPPVDGCAVRGVYGRRWNDWRGTHDAVEVAFTPLGGRFFLEQAAARDLGLFVRSPGMRTIRDRIRRGGPVPPAAQITAGYPERVVPLSERRQVLPPGQIGVWTDEEELIVVTTQTETGRRLYVELRSGRVGPHNIGSLGFVF